jgi:hypothetical protein
MSAEKQLYPIQIDHQLSLPRHYRLRFTEKQARMIYAEYEKKYPGQSFEQLHARGGFGILEAIYLLTGEFVNIEALPTGLR